MLSHSCGGGACQAQVDGPHGNTNSAPLERVFPASGTTFPPHTRLTVSFRLELHGSWDGNASGLGPNRQPIGPDRWSCKVAGMEQPLYAGALRATPSTRFINISKPFDHSAGSVRLLFYSSTTDPNEKWSLHDLRVTPSYVPVTLSFNKTVVKAGKSYMPRDVRGTITASIRPVAGAPAISFTSSNRDRATVSETGRVNRDGATIVTLKVSGESPTPTDFPQGDAQVEARRGNNVLRTAQIKVVIPRYVSYSIGASSYTNYTKNSRIAAGKILLGSIAATIVRYNIKDQFGDPLDGIYNGSNVVEEKFSGYRGIRAFEGGFPTRWTPITEPQGDQLTNGRKLDKSGVFNESEDDPNGQFPASIGPAWRNNTQALLDNGVRRKNLIRLLLVTTGNTTASGLQQLRVHGFWMLTPSYRRTKHIRDADYPPVPHSITQTAE